MLLLAKLIGIFILTLGLVYLISAQATRSMLKFWRQGKRFYVAGGLRGIFGTVLILEAGDARLISAVIGFGALFIIFGIAIFIPPYERPLSAIQWFQEKTDLELRLLALPLLGVGVLLLFCI